MLERKTFLNAIRLRVRRLQTGLRGRHSARTCVSDDRFPRGGGGGGSVGHRACLDAAQIMALLFVSL